MPSLYHYLSLSALLFCIGIFGVLTRRNAIGILMAIELLFNAVNINFVAFARFIDPQAIVGQVFTIFVITIAAAEAAVGLAIIILIYRQHKGVDVDKVNIMKW